MKERQIQQRDGSLTELSHDELNRLYLEGLAKKRAKQAQGRAQTFDDLVAIGHSKGMKNPEGWARHVIAAREKKLSHAS